MDEFELEDIIKLKESTKNKLWLENRLYNYLNSYGIIDKIQFGWARVEFNISNPDEILLFRKNKVKRRFKLEELYKPCINY